MLKSPILLLVPIPYLTKFLFPYDVAVRIREILLRDFFILLNRHHLAACEKIERLAAAEEMVNRIGCVFGKYVVLFLKYLE